MWSFTFFLLQFFGAFPDFLQLYFVYERTISSLSDLLVFASSIF